MTQNFISYHRVSSANLTALTHLRQRVLSLMMLLALLGHTYLFLALRMPSNPAPPPNSLAQLATHTPMPSATATLTPLEAALQWASTPVTRNADWTPIIQNFQGITWVLVPTGCFQMGNASRTYYFDGSRWLSSVSDGGEQCFDTPFWMMETEVTNAYYGSVDCPSFSSIPNQPRNCVTWFEAQDFCQSIGGRLPTEREWEYAARGVESWFYPWGNEYAADFVIGDMGNLGTARVRSRLDGASWVGALHLLGNLWEWTSSLYQPYPYVADDGRESHRDTNNKRVIRGGSFHNDSTILHSAVRSSDSPAMSSDFFGFRCARDVDNSTHLSPSSTITAEPTSAVNAPAIPSSEVMLTPDVNINHDLAPEQLALTPVARNADWTPIIQNFQGMAWVLVPAGCFQMGSNDAYYDDEQPVHEQCIDQPFWIQQTEVTNAQYGSVSSNVTCADYSSEPNQPRNCVMRVEAQDYCESLDGRLPTEVEWEYAARGVESWTYPWGNVYDASALIGVDDPTYGLRKTAPVGRRPAGASWVGALDLSGNLWEWTSSLYQPYPYVADDGRESDIDTNNNRVLRGGSYSYGLVVVRGAVRAYYTNIFNNYTIGFRCVRLAPS